MHIVDGDTYPMRRCGTFIANSFRSVVVPGSYERLNPFPSVPTSSRGYRNSMLLIRVIVSVLVRPIREIVINTGSNRAAFGGADAERSAFASTGYLSNLFTIIAHTH